MAGDNSKWETLYTDPRMSREESERIDLWLTQTPQQRTRALRRAAIANERWGELFAIEGMLLRDEVADYFNRYSDCMSSQIYWQVLRTCWQHADPLWENPRLWRKFFKADRRWKYYLMRPSERKALRGMNDELTIYRGYAQRHQYYKTDRLRMAWTLSKTLAGWFANRYKREGDVPRLVTATCRKEDVHGYFESRSEWEIVIDPSDVTIVSDSERWLKQVRPPTTRDF